MSANTKFQEPQNAKPIRAVFSTTGRYGASGESLKSPSDFLQIEFKCHHHALAVRDVLIKMGRFPRPFSFAFNSSKLCTKIRATGIVLKILS